MPPYITTDLIPTLPLYFLHAAAAVLPLTILSLICLCCPRYLPSNKDASWELFYYFTGLDHLISSSIFNTSPMALLTHSSHLKSTALLRNLNPKHLLWCHMSYIMHRTELTSIPLPCVPHGYLPTCIFLFSYCCHHHLGFKCVHY